MCSCLCACTHIVWQLFSVRHTTHKPWACDTQPRLPGIFSLSSFFLFFVVASQPKRLVWRRATSVCLSLSFSVSLYVSLSLFCSLSSEVTKACVRGQTRCAMYAHTFIRPPPHLPCGDARKTNTNGCPRLARRHYCRVFMCVAAKDNIGFVARTFLCVRVM